MKAQCILALALTIIGATTAKAEVENNIVITESTDHYTFVPDKQGSKIVSIKHTSANTFMATRAPGTAMDYVFYDSFSKVNKANVKAKGVKPVYQSAISSGIFYDDSKICAVTVPLEEINKPVKAEFEITSSRPDLEPFTYIGNLYPVKHGTITLSMPIEFKDKYDIMTSNIGDNVTITRSPSGNGRDWEITLDYHDMPALKSPDDAPPGRFIHPCIQFVGNFADAQDLYRHLHKFTTEPDPDIDSVKAKAIEITSGCNDDESRVQAIYEWVNRNIRYVAIEHGDLGNIPDHASEVLRKRFGDCKGSANLIKAMLTSIGLDGRLVWIGTSSIPYDFTDRPGFATGNHMIAAVKLPNDSIIYLDGTVGLADYGIYSPGIQGKQTLVENGDNCIIGRVPVQSPLTSSDIVTLDLTLTDNTLVGTVTDSLTGRDKAGLLNLLNDSSADEYKKVLDNRIIRRRTSWHPTDTKLINGAPGNGASVITANLKIDRALRHAGEKQYLTIDMLPGLSTLQFNTKDRKFGGWINTVGRTLTSATIKIDSSLSPSKLPSPLTIDNRWFSARIEYGAADNQLTAMTEIIFKSQLVEFQDLETFNNDIKRVAKAANMTFVLTTAQ